MTYYYLYCHTCSERFMPLLCTEPSELLHPDYEETARGGIANAESLERFHERHRRHELAELVNIPESAHPEAVNPSSHNQPTLPNPPNESTS